MSVLKYYNTLTSTWEPATLGDQGATGPEGATGAQGATGVGTGTENKIFNGTSYANVASSGGNLIVGVNSNEWTFGTDGKLTFTNSNLTISPGTDLFGTTTALISTANNVPLLSMSTGSTGSISSIWIEDYDNVFSSNIAAVYTNPTAASGIVRIVTGNNSTGTYLWDFGADGKLTLPQGMDLSQSIKWTYYDSEIFEDGGLNIESRNSGISLTSSDDIVITVDNGGKQWKFKTNGDLTLPAGGDIKDTGTGLSVLGGGGSLGTFAAYYSNLYSATESDVYISSFYDSGPGYSYLKLPNNDNATGNATVLSNYKENGAGVSIITSNPNNGATEYTWNFSANGIITLPNTMTIDGSGYGGENVQIGGASTWISVNNNGAPPGFYVTTDADGAYHQWSFTTDGNIMLPQTDMNSSPAPISWPGITFSDGTFQNTAWQGSAVISETVPENDLGRLWFNSAEARMYIKYNEQWVDSSPTVLPPPDTNPTFESVTFNDATIQTTAWTGTYSYNDLTDKPVAEPFVGGGGASTWLTAN